MLNCVLNSLFKIIICSNSSKLINAICFLQIISSSYMQRNRSWILFYFSFFCNRNGAGRDKTALRREYWREEAGGFC